MRLLIPGILAVLLSLAACRTPPDQAPASAAEEPADDRSLEPATARGGGLGTRTVESAASTNAPTPAPIVLPTSGRIHRVILGQRFVVVDYTLGGMPPLESLVNVYRAGEKVGELRLSGPENNGFVAADIVDGFIQVDDEVRVH